MLPSVHASRHGVSIVCYDVVRKSEVADLFSFRPSWLVAMSMSLSFNNARFPDKDIVHVLHIHKQASESQKLQQFGAG